jgi:hypothetical protein
MQISSCRKQCDYEKNGDFNGEEKENNTRVSHRVAQREFAIVKPQFKDFWPLMRVTQKAQIRMEGCSNITTSLFQLRTLKNAVKRL